MTELLSMSLFPDSVQGLLTDTVALATVALIGYLFGQRTRDASKSKSETGPLLSEVCRATEIARQLQVITSRIREDIAMHQANVNRFKNQLSHIGTAESPDSWMQLSNETEMLLTPTMKLASDLSLAYDELRKQSNQLLVFTGTRIDTETGIRNRRAMEEQLKGLLSNHDKTASRFSLALFSIDNDYHDVTISQLKEFAATLDSSARDTDIVARYSDDEFAVLMPNTSLAGATIFSQRLLNVYAERTYVISGGIVEVQTGDTSERIISRADSALYSARSDSVSCLYQHTGTSIRLHETTGEDDSNIESWLNSDNRTSELPKAEDVHLSANNN